jgi:hypothetical protein
VPQFLFTRLTSLKILAQINLGVHDGCPVQACKCVRPRVQGCVVCTMITLKNCLVLFSHLTDQKTHSFLTCVGVRTTAEWRCAEPTSGLGVVPGLYKPKPKPRPASRCRGSNIITRRNLVQAANDLFGCSKTQAICYS